MDLSIVLVNYNTADYTSNCIQSIINETVGLEYEIIIVDNASTDNSKELICGRFPNVRWFDMNYNSGFARANNIGIKHAQGENILLLNTDTIIQENALKKAVDLFINEPGCVACGVQLLNEDLSHQISGAKSIKGGLNFFLSIPYFGSLLKILGGAVGVEKPSVLSIHEKQKVDWVYGAFTLTNKKTIDKAGLLDEDFFMYAEEMEWCSRLKKFGDIYLFAEPKVIHFGGGSSSKQFNSKINDNNVKEMWTNKGRQIILSWMLRVRKEFGAFWYIVFCFILFFAGLVSLIIWPIDFLINITQSPNYLFKDLMGLNKNIISNFRFFFKILLQKKYFYKVI